MHVSMFVCMLPQAHVDPNWYKVIIEDEWKNNYVGKTYLLMYNFLTSGMTIRKSDDTYLLVYIVNIFSKITF